VATELRTDCLLKRHGIVAYEAHRPVLSYLPKGFHWPSADRPKLERLVREFERLENAAYRQAAIQGFAYYHAPYPSEVVVDYELKYPTFTNSIQETAALLRELQRLGSSVDYADFVIQQLNRGRLTPVPVDFSGHSRR
jgi:hypothetical protein